MALEKKFPKLDELMALKDRFNPEFMNKEYLGQVLSELGQKPVWYTDLNEPEVNSGLVICRQCRYLYWVTPRTDVVIKITSQKAVDEGPFCTPCSYQIMREN